LAVETAYASLMNPLSIHAVMGFGRSYGKESGFLGKKFSGISSARIWEALEENSTQRTIAFLTDVGNDLGYEQPVEVIMEWVIACASRLQSYGARVVLTGLPLDVLRGMSASKFTLLRSLLFPSCRLSWGEMLSRADDLGERLAALSKSQEIPIFSVPNAWYGFDPIHPKRARMRDYWRELFAQLELNRSENPERRLSWPSYWRLRTLTSPGLGRKVSPGHFSSRRIMLSDGTSIALY
jgi:hypothetical protein